MAESRSLPPGRQPVHLAVVLALLGGAGALHAQQPNFPPSHPGFPLVLSGRGSVVFSKPVIADLGLSADGTKQIVFGTNHGELHVIYKNSSNVWGEAPGFPVAVGNFIASTPAVGVLADGLPDIVVGWGDTSTGGPGGVKAYRR